MKRLEEHTDSVTRVFWLPDGTGFISGGLDRKLILWVSYFHCTDVGSFAELLIERDR